MIREFVEAAGSGAELAGVLAMIVAIRTFLGWSLALELEGRWPWQRRSESVTAISSTP